ncbi:MAG TPA: bifunctional DNA-binding transcriptional regulator/O6-methylguanine-DNA methyltransferase Ada [Dehalococcoidia bacterium]|nr:bifunctional DNA-binding transcriptional regulator/O6-methylguanine-DNA methyltransferase Ada [Dehalococcoidia bacterium]
MNQRASDPTTSDPLDNETRWQATEQRNARFDGLFVYAVRSTGIYCRPTCPSRRPRREQVAFFDACDDAEAAGFRPCRRCRPRDIAREVATTEALCQYIETHLDEPLPLARLGEASGFSPFHVQRTFKRVTGLTPRQYIEERRMQLLKGHLRDGSDVTTALYDAGYGSSSRLYERGSLRLGMTPKVYGQGAAGVDIYYAIVDTALGRLLVATTTRGVCAVSFGDNDDELLDALRSEYPEADLRPGTPAENGWVEAIAAFIDGAEIPADLPVDVRATAFQRRVWAFLRTIPRGETRSYGEVARGIEQPAAARAVAQACAHNPIALIVPCHRVVRGNGQTGGYRWGADRKRALLERERG